MTTADAPERERGRAGREVRRLAAFLDRPSSAELAQLQGTGGACPSERVIDWITAYGRASAIRWWDETQGLPAERAFILDLADRPSPQGGLLLELEGDRVSGWRPEAGALTIFEPGALVLTPLAPGAESRRAIIGRLL